MCRDFQGIIDTYWTHSDLFYEIPIFAFFAMRFFRERSKISLLLSEILMKNKDLDLTTYPTKVNIATYLRKKKWTSNFEKVHILARFCCFLANIAIFRLIINDFQKVRLAKLDLKSDQNMKKKLNMRISLFIRQKWTSLPTRDKKSEHPYMKNAVFLTNFHCFCASFIKIPTISKQFVLI